MKKLYLTALMVGAISLVLTPAVVNAVSVSPSADAEIIPSLSISITQPLDFGDIIAGSSVSEISIDPDGSNLSVDTGDATLEGGGPQQAIVSVTGGDSGHQVSLSFGNVGPLSDTGTNGGADMGLTVTGNPTASSGPSLDSSGDLTINIGGTLTVGASQVVSTYSGSFDVNVNYQ